MRFATHDGPGIRTTIFFNGCPLACWWCHNPESQSLRPSAMYAEERCRHCGDCIQACPERAIEEVNGVLRTRDTCRRCGTCADACQADARRLAGRRVSLSELLAEIERDLVFFEQSGGGVTLSGGEPLAQPRFALALLRACRERRIHTTVETCGFAPQATFQAVAREAALVLFDLKTLDGDKHQRYTGVFNDLILCNLEWLAATGSPLVVRIPVIPTFNDSAKDARQFARYLSGLGVSRASLLPYHAAGREKYKRLGRAPRWSGESAPVNGLAHKLREAGLTITIGN